MIFRQNQPDVYMQVLAFAKDNPGFTRGMLKEKFGENFDWIVREIQDNRLFQSSVAGGLGEVELYLSFDDRFRLLEHEELQDARRSSRRAMTVAIISILLTLAGVGYQISTTQKVYVVNQATISQPIPKYENVPND